MYKHSNFNNLNKLINCHSTDLLITQKKPKQNTNLKCYSKVEPLLGLNLCQNLLRKIRFVNKQVPVCFHWQYKHTKTFFVDVYFVLDALYKEVNKLVVYLIGWSWHTSTCCFQNSSAPFIREYCNNAAVNASIVQEFFL